MVLRVLRLLAFDLDGVLYSSEPFLGTAYRESIARVNAIRPGSFARVPETGEIMPHIGWPVPVILARLFPDAAPAAIELLHQATLDAICARVTRREGMLYPAVPETLAELHARGVQLAVASNGRTRYVETVLDTYGLGARFVERITADQVGDKSAVLRAYLERLRVPARAAVMIGDRASDVDAARAVGCHFIGCDYGHGHRDEIADAGPLVGDFAALPAVLERLDGSCG